MFYIKSLVLYENSTYCFAVHVLETLLDLPQSQNFAKQINVNNNIQQN